MNIGKNIRDRRKALHINAETLAKRIGVSPSTVYRYENGDIDKIDSEKLIPIADALYTTPAALLGVSEDTSEENVVVARTPEAKFVTQGMDHMPEEIRKRLVQMVTAAFAEYLNKPQEERNDNNDA